MKLIAIFLIICVFQVYGNIYRELYKGNSITQLCANSEKVVQLEQTDVSKAYKCFLACIAKNIGTMNEDNSFNPTMIKIGLETLITDLHVEKNDLAIDLVIDNCTKLSSYDDECDTAEQAFNCFALTFARNATEFITN